MMLRETAVLIPLICATMSHGFQISSLQALHFQPALRNSGSTACSTARNRYTPLSLTMGNGYVGEVKVEIKRNFGDKFFLRGVYTNEERPAPREWTFQRTWADFYELDTGLRSDADLLRMGSAKVQVLPPEPYLIGEESSPEPFQKYLDQVFQHSQTTHVAIGLMVSFLHSPLTLVFVFRIFVLCR
jgi:hypothetical protein